MRLGTGFQSCRVNNQTGGALMKPNSDQNITTAWTNGLLATMDPEVDDQYGILPHHSLLTQGARIIGIAPTRGLDLADFDEVVDLNRALVTPGLVDCHTHLVFGGDRAGDWEMRLNGFSYAQVAAQGGGINLTVTATRQTSFDDLYRASRHRLEAMMAEGVTLVEAKSGYGLELEAERKLLEVVRGLDEYLEVDLVPTLLAAHSLPPEFVGRPDDYIEEICRHIMPKLWREGLFEAVDIFVENMAFNLDQARRLFRAAAELGIPVKAHAEQMSAMGAGRLVAEFGGLSADHLEYLDEDGVLAMSGQGVVAVLLPQAFYFLRDAKVPPIDLMRRHGVPLAVATDFNPGTSPFASIRQAMNMACTLFGLTPAEALAGVTRQAARALGRGHSHGQLKSGYKADFAVWEVKRPVEIFYELSASPLVDRVFNGISSMF